jgi:hypothetical protein
MADRRRRTPAKSGQQDQQQTAEVEETQVETEQPESQETGSTEAAPTEGAPATLEEALALLAERERELAEAKAKPVRAPRELKPTPKQARFLRGLIADPTKSVPELCEQAGATATSHGFVFRMLEHGFLSVSVPADVIERFGLNTEEPTTEEPAEGSTEEQVEQTA